MSEEGLTGDQRSMNAFAVWIARWWPSAFRTWRPSLTTKEVSELRQAWEEAVAWCDAGKPEAPGFVLTEKGRALVEKLDRNAR